MVRCILAESQQPPARLVCRNWTFSLIQSGKSFLLIYAAHCLRLVLLTERTKRSYRILLKFQSISISTRSNEADLSHLISKTMRYKHHRIPSPCRTLLCPKYKHWHHDNACIQTSCHIWYLILNSSHTRHYFHPRGMCPVRCLHTKTPGRWVFLDADLSSPASCGDGGRSC